MIAQTKEQREEEILTNIIQILERHLHPERIILFGSRAKGKYAGNPDFDLAIDCAYPEFHILRKIDDEIEEAAGLYSVDVVFLPRLNESFKTIIFKTGVVIYERGK